MLGLKADACLRFNIQYISNSYLFVKRFRLSRVKLLFDVSVMLSLLSFTGLIPPVNHVIIWS